MPLSQHFSTMLPKPAADNGGARTNAHQHQRQNEEEKQKEKAATIANDLIIPRNH